MKSFKQTLGYLSLACIAGLTVSGCSQTEDDSADETGQVVIALTDAEGDFLAYEVAVESIVLHRQNGNTVETLSNSAVVDFAQYTDLTELLSAATVPSGTYDQVEIRVDYSAANIVVQDDQGQSIPAIAVDDSGEPLSAFTLDLNMNQPLVVAPGIPAHLTIDFDLDSSNQISDDFTTVTVEPVLIADAELVESRDHRVRGLLTAVSEEGDSFTMDLRPFRFRDGRFGEFEVTLGDATQYEIDGVSLAGEEAVAALSDLATDTPIVVQGTFTTADQVFTANELLAGSSVPWSDDDVLKGAITKREGDTLWISGGILELDDGMATYGREIQVQLQADTQITKAGETDLGSETLSVGSRILAVGNYIDNDETDDSFEPELIRVLKSQFKGQVTAIDNSLTVDLFSLNKRRPAAFDFAGTGMDTSMDADPGAYEVDTSSLSLANIEVEESVIVRGYVNDFGAAPADFNANTVAEWNLQRLADLLHLDFRPASTEAISNLTETGLTITVDADQLFDFDHVRKGRDRIRLNDGIEITVNPADNGHFVVKKVGSKALFVYRNFADFSASLTEELDSGEGVAQIHGGGLYDTEENQFTANKLVVVLKTLD